MTENPRLSLCMIVKNEEEMLPDFLSATAGLYDELCVVDTGSTDETIPLLRQREVRLEQRPWDDDFAAARNASLALATGDWVLFLDADERPDAEVFASVRAVIQDDSVGAASLWFENLLPGGQRNTMPLLRLFRSDPRIRFRHRIHEDITAAIEEFLATETLRHVTLAGKVTHLGYLRERAQTKDKKSRDVALLRRCLEEDPEDHYSRFKLIESARYWQDRALWQRESAVLSGLLRENPDAPILRGPHGPELVVLLADGLFPGEPRAALDVVEEWSALGVHGPPLWLRRAQLLEVLGNMEEATASYERCLASARLRDREQMKTRAHLGLSRVALARGALDVGAAHAHAAVAENPRDLEALVASLSFAGLTGGSVRVNEVAAQHRARYGDDDTLEEALGEQSLLSGAFERAVMHLRRAAGDAPTGRRALRLAQALLAAGHLEECRELCAVLAPTEPAANVGTLVLDLAESKSSELAIDLDEASANHELRQWTALLLHGRATTAARIFAENSAFVAGVFPWLPGYVERLRGGGD